MAGLLVFRTLAEARRAGFEVLDKTATGYLVRARRAEGWALALVEPDIAPPIPA
jgi:hypothetical protein